MKSRNSIRYARAFLVSFAVAIVAVVSNPPIFNDIASGQTEDTSVCARTPGIREAIVSAVFDLRDNPDNQVIVPDDFDGCEDVTDDHLAAITGLPDLDLDQNLLKSTPKNFDLHGLTMLASLDLSTHRLGSLPAGFFSETPEITSLHLQVTKLTTLPAGVFDPLDQLQTLSLYRNLFTTFPDGLNSLTQTNFPKLRSLTLGLDFRNPYWHFSSLPAGWVANLPTGLTDLRLNYVELTDAEAASLASRLTAIQFLSFDYDGMSLNGFIRMFENLNTDLHTLRISGDKLGVWYASATEQQKTELAAALSRLSLDNLYIEDTTITAAALDAILNGLQPTAQKITVQKGNLVGFTGESLADYTNLQVLDLEDNNLT